jgi:phosphoadenosine phosphosulfate reductase
MVTELTPIEEALNRHKRIAFQFSGGKDSIAALFLMKPYWDRFTVYFCDTGDCLVETVNIVEKVSKLVPRFETVQGRVEEVRAKFGWPTDVLPWTSAQAAHNSNVGFSVLLQDRVSCCFRSIMLPLHERMLADSITLIIRGQKDSDKMKGRFRSGDVVDGIEFLYPVQNWTDGESFAYMRLNGIEPQRFYTEGMKHSGDCASCTAWCDDDRGEYLKRYHPDKFINYQHNMTTIAAAVRPALRNFEKELEVCHG